MDRGVGGTPAMRVKEALTVHSPPLKWQHLARDPPSGDVGKANNRAEGRRQTPDDAGRLQNLQSRNCAQRRQVALVPGSKVCLKRLAFSDV